MPTNKKSLQTYVSDDVKKKVTEQAKKENRSESQMVAVIVTSYYSQPKKI